MTHTHKVYLPKKLEKGMAITTIFLPGKFHGQRSLVGYGPWGHILGCHLSDFTFFISLAKKGFGPYPDSIRPAILLFVLQISFEEDMKSFLS